MNFAPVVYLCVALAYGGITVPLALARGLRMPRSILAAALVAVWALCVAFDWQAQTVAWFLQASAWVAVVDALHTRFSAPALPRLRRIVRLVIGFGLAGAILAALAIGFPVGWLAGYLIEARLVLALATLILIENVYRNANEDVRWHVNLPLIAIGGMAAFTFILYGDAIVHGRLSLELFEAQAVIYLMLVPLFLVTQRRSRRWRNKMALSHGAAFYTSSLILGGSFMIGLGVLATAFRGYRSGWGPLIEITAIAFGVIVMAVLAGSGSARSRLHRLVVENFFAQRYDYRREWLRCIDTLAAIEEGGLPQRVIKVLADTVDCPSGVLLLRDDGATEPAFRAAGEWNMRAPLTPIGADDPLLAPWARDGHGLISDAAASHLPVPDGLATTPACWLAVALPDPRAPTPIGIVLLGRPRAAATLDRESLALLRVVAREISLMLAERRAAEALAEARRFAAAGQRFAFVAHDIKNVANQLALLVSNADQHMNDPLFREDMMATLRGSVGKIQSMLTRLKTPEHAPALHLDVAERLNAITTAASRQGQVGVVLDLDRAGGAVAMEPAAFDAVMTHLIDNAVEASAPGQVVAVALGGDDGTVEITISDCGTGMSEAFVRDELFRPFTSSKPAGFGLGAFQARELVHAAGGRLAISSTVGAGTTVRVSLPAQQAGATAAKLMVA